MKDYISKNYHWFIGFFYLLQMYIGKFINNLLGYNDVAHNYFYIWEYTWFRIFAFAVPIVLVLIYRLFIHRNECLTARNRTLVYTMAALVIIMDIFHIVKVPSYMYLILIFIILGCTIFLYGRFPKT